MEYLNLKINLDYPKEILEKVENGSTLLTSSSKTARKFIFLYRKYKLEKKEKVWESPKIFTLKFFIDLLFDELITEKLIPSYEDSLLLMSKVIKENYPVDAPLFDIALEYLRHYEFKEKNKIDLMTSGNDFFNLRNRIFSDFEKIREENNFLSLSEEIDEIKRAATNDELSLPKEILVLDREDFSPLENDFIDFISKKSSLCECKVDYSKVNLNREVFLYEDVQSEIEASLNNAIELWESGERSIAIGYFDDYYKEKIESALFDFSNSPEDSQRYYIEDNQKIEHFASYEIVRNILTLSKGVVSENLFHLISSPLFKEKLPKDKLKSIFECLNKNYSSGIEEFKKKFDFDEALDIFLENRKEKISEVVKTLKKIIESHFDFKSGTSLFQSYKEISNSFEFFETKDWETTPLEFEKLFSICLRNINIENKNEFCGIQVVSYRNCVYQNFKKLFLVGANLSALPNPVPVYPLFSGEEKDKCDLLKLENHFQKEEIFLKKVIATNGEVIISRARRKNDEPFISSPFFKGMETEKKWNKYDFSINKYYIPNHIVKTISSEYIGQFKERTNFAIEFPETLNVTSEAANIFSCPFLFFIENCLRVSEPDEFHILMKSSEVGTFLHKLISNIGDILKDLSDLQSDTVEKIKDISKKLIKDQNFPEIQKNSLSVFLLGNNAREGFIDKFLEFEKKRIEEGWKIDKIEESLSIGLPDLDNKTIRGKPDRIEISRDNSTARIIDFKAKSGNVTEREKLQVFIYTKLFNSICNRINTDGLIYKLFAGDKNFSKVNNGNELYQRFKSSYENIKNGVINPDPYPTNYGKPCNYCVYDLLCHIDKEFENQIDEDEPEN